MSNNDVSTRPGCFIASGTTVQGMSRTVRGRKVTCVALNATLVASKVTSGVGSARPIGQKVSRTHRSSVVPAFLDVQQVRIWERACFVTLMTRRTAGHEKATAKRGAGSMLGAHFDPAVSLRICGAAGFAMARSPQLSRGAARRRYLGALVCPGHGGRPTRQDSTEIRMTTARPPCKH